jgi:SAM-dependent methyltransferase
MHDVFLAYNNIDKLTLRVVSNKLKNLGLETWLDEEQIPPGTPFQAQIQRAINEVRAAAIFVGEGGLGRWQSIELESFISQFAKKNIPVIPVLLPGVSHIPDELAFLNQFNPVIFENDIEDKKAIESLYWGITGRKLNQPPDCMKRGEIFDNITDATLYLDYTSQDPISEIQLHIHQTTLIPPKYIYSFPYGANLWVELCNDPDEYRYYADSIRFIQQIKSDIIESIDPEIIQLNPDYVSLGCGNGKKDRILLEQLLHQSKSINPRSYYYPYDISAVLLSRAIKEVSRSELLKQRLRIKAIEADFKNLPLFKPVYQYRQEPNIFALLGNTLGNMQYDGGFLQQVRDVMFPDDVFLVEVKLYREDDIELSGEIQLLKQFDFTPLRWLGVTYQAEKLRYSVLENVSSARDTKTLVAEYCDFKIELGEAVSTISRSKLAYIHLYQKNSSNEVYGLEEVFRSVGFEIRQRFVSESTAVFILKIDSQLKSLESQ